MFSCRRFWFAAHHHSCISRCTLLCFSSQQKFGVYVYSKHWLRLFKAKQHYLLSPTHIKKSSWKTGGKEDTFGSGVALRSMTSTRNMGEEVQVAGRKLGSVGLHFSEGSAVALDYIVQTSKVLPVVEEALISLSQRVSLVSTKMLATSCLHRAIAQDLLFHFYLTIYFCEAREKWALRHIGSH